MSREPLISRPVEFTRTDGKIGQRRFRAGRGKLAVLALFTYLLLSLHAVWHSSPVGADSADAASPHCAACLIGEHSPTLTTAAPVGCLIAGSLHGGFAHPHTPVQECLDGSVFARAPPAEASTRIEAVG